MRTPLDDAPLSLSAGMAQQCFIGTRKRLMSKCKTCDVRRMGVNNSAYVRSLKIDAGVHPNNLAGYRGKRAFHDLAIEGDYG